MMKLMIVAGILALGVSSCATTAGTQGDSAYLELPRKIKKGKSKQADVLAVMGKPDQKRLEPEGETWVYGSIQPSGGEEVLGSAIGTGLSFVPYAGSAWGLLRSVGRAQQSSEPAAVVRFSPSGLVRDYEVTLPR